MRFSGDFGGRGEGIWWESTSVLRMARFQTSLVHILMRRVVQFCMGIAICHRRNFGTKHKYHTINTLEWPNSHKLKIQDGGGRHLEFRKNVNNFGLDKDILHQTVGKFGGSKLPYQKSPENSATGRHPFGPSIITRKNRDHSAM